MPERSSPNASAPEIPGVDLQGVIGSGGSGVVYLGRQAAFDRDVAVKVASNTSPGDDATHRWEREVAAIGRLSNHPNIVPVFDAGITDDGSPYLVMPHVPGGTLGDRLRAEGPMDPEEVAAIGAKLAGTLATVHAAGVLHRDVKPDNVLWSPHGEPQLTDFGIARLQDLTTTLGGGLEATIAYAAPEVLKGEPASEATDVYGLGATLYACLTGASPHPSDRGQHPAALIAKALEESPAPLRSAGVPAALAAVIDRAMSRAPAERQQSAEELRLDLERAAASIGSGGDTTAVQEAATTSVFAAAPAASAADEVATKPQRRASVPAPTRPPERSTAAPPRRAGTDRNWGLWAAMIAILALFVGLLAFGITRESGDDGDQAGVTDQTTTESDDAAPTSEATEPPATSEDTSAPSTEATDASGGEDSSDGDGSSSAGSATEAAVTYLRTLDRGELEEAWQLTTPRFQAQQDRESWEGFWSRYDIEIVGEPSRSGSTVIVPLTLDGQREDYQLTMVQQGGSWLVDGPVGN